MIYVDIDGVLRRLDRIALGRDAICWKDCNEKKESLLKIIDHNLDLLVQAEPTEYLDYFNTWPELHLLTSQKKEWRKYTYKWLQEHLKVPFDITYSKSADDKLRYLNKKDFIIDDSPMFSNFAKVILIDKAYNKNVHNSYRIHNVEELKMVMKHLESLS